MNTMTTISASDVADLRKQTGAGLMDCKKALKNQTATTKGRSITFARRAKKLLKNERTKK